MTFANRTRELEFFGQMLRRERAERILLIEAPSGYGKTGLMTRFKALCPQMRTLAVYINLKAAREEGILYVYNRTQDVLGEASFPKLRQQIAQFLNAGVDIQGNRLTGEDSQIQVFQTNSPEQRLMRLRQLHNAFFEDLQQMKRSIVFIFDTFNEAPEELAGAIGDRFLVRVAESDHLLAVVAGQQVPQPGAEWQHCCHHRTLSPITKLEDWYAYAEAVNLPFSQEEIRLAVDYWQGVPAQVVEMLEVVARQRQQS
jgi:hypothetical protein